METEKHILDDILYEGMKSEDKTKKKINLEDITQIQKLNLDIRVGESQKDYHERLLAIQTTQVALIFSYEEEKDLERMRNIRHDFKHLLERGNSQDEVDVKEVILTLYEEVKQYLIKYSHFHNQEKVQEKLKDLESIT